jgi:hypothetical protein
MMKATNMLTVLFLLAGCSANTESVGGATSALELEGLPQVDAATITGASDGCEGAITGDESFVVEANMLVVAVRDERPVCIDTLEAIAEELRSLALADRAEIIADAYARTTSVEEQLQAEQTHLTGFSTPYQGDPNPEPSKPNEGDPNPEPSRPRGSEPPPRMTGSNGNTAGAGDPNPEPSSPPISPVSPVTLEQFVDNI